MSLIVSNNRADEGRVLAVWPAIGMVDVQFPEGDMRLSVDELQIMSASEDEYVAPIHSDIPGGTGTVPVPGFGVEASRRRAETSLRRVIALYWKAKDRKYRCTRSEWDQRSYLCPKCGETLKSTVYKRESGASDKLLGCPGCMFLIRQEDILADHCEEEV